ncbi:HbrB family protein [Schizosaccharomyces japonicus yFS275]|uniref:HbrB family protein n=1 Tax=Schizosaccharomyces japonicus (strain yFS275 / FY16936) TaxID=402676 RepID=B6K8B0_SCHJY|nr:HbrB family protein [Schizosaccharomyces japonicus yFS275]EEB09764.2 HbrB family protein [Schizosaccharomyces japonicus yFS275]
MRKSPCFCFPMSRKKSSENNSGSLSEKKVQRQSLHANGVSTKQKVLSRCRNSLHIREHKKGPVTIQSCWDEFYATVRPLIEALKQNKKFSIESTIETSNDVLNQCIRLCSSKADVDQLLQLMLHDIRVDVIAVQSYLHDETNNFSLSSLLQRWTLFYTHVLPYLESLFVPVSELMQLDNTAGSSMARLSVDQTISLKNVHMMLLVCFRNYIFVPQLLQFDASVFISATSSEALEVYQMLNILRLLHTNDKYQKVIERMLLSVSVRRF